MNPIVVVFSLNAMLLLIHEMDSAFEKEWDILKLPGGLKGFLLLHVPIVLLMFYGEIELVKGTVNGVIVGLVLGLGGMLPFFVHEILVKRKDHFNGILSRVVIYANLGTGIALLCMSLVSLLA